VLGICALDTGLGIAFCGVARGKSNTIKFLLTIFLYSTRIEETNNVKGELDIWKNIPQLVFNNY
jgi:hypothetical protein